MSKDFIQIPFYQQLANLLLKQVKSPLILYDALLALQVAQSKVRVKCIVGINTRQSLLNMLKALNVDIISTHIHVYDAAMDLSKILDDHTLVDQQMLNPLASELLEPWLKDKALLATDNSELIEYLQLKYDVNGVSFEPSQLRHVPITDAYQTARNFMLKEQEFIDPLLGACLFIRKDEQIIGFQTWMTWFDTLMNPTWLIEHGIQPKVDKNKYRGASVEDLQLPEAVCIDQEESIEVAVTKMITRDFSQLPVMNQKKLVGFLSLSQAVNQHGKVKDYCVPLKWRHKYQIITPATPLEELEMFLDKHPFAIVTDESGRFILAVCTKVDLLRFMSHR